MVFYDTAPSTAMSNGPYYYLSDKLYGGFGGSYYPFSPYYGRSQSNWYASRPFFYGYRPSYANAIRYSYGQRGLQQNLDAVVFPSQGTGLRPFYYYGDSYWMHDAKADKAPSDKAPSDKASANGRYVKQSCTAKDLTFYGGFSQ